MHADEMGGLFIFVITVFKQLNVNRSGILGSACNSDDKGSHSRPCSSLAELGRLTNLLVRTEHVITCNK